jgi:hypothetical protein
MQKYLRLLYEAYEKSNIKVLFVIDQINLFYSVVRKMNNTYRQHKDAFDKWSHIYFTMHNTITSIKFLPFKIVFNSSINL